MRKGKYGTAAGWEQNVLGGEQNSSYICRNVPCMTLFTCACYPWPFGPTHVFRYYFTIINCMNKNRLEQLGMEESTPLIEIFRLLKYHHIHMASFHTPNIYIIILIE
jgi:hypothetical protein